MSTIEDIVGRLKRAEWLMRPETQRILALLDGPDGRTRAVGGIVRDTLLDLPREASDIDIATELTPDEVSLRAGRAGIAVYPTGIEHGTVTLRLGALTAEVTTLREDVETDGRHAVVRFGTDWARDAARRDFTLNALYAEMDGTLFDPLHGLEDCLQPQGALHRRPGPAASPRTGCASTASSAFRRAMREEQFDADGLAACAAAAGTLGQLASERVGAEMRRMLGLPRVARTLRAMSEAHILELPGDTVELLHSYERRARRPELAARLAILVRALGSEMLQQLWRLSNDDIRTAETTLAAARLIGDFALNEAAYRYPATLADAIEVAATLSNWTDAGRQAVLDQLQRSAVPTFPLNGTDLIVAGLKPGKALGIELERLERAWIDSGFALDRQALLAMVRPI